MVCVCHISSAPVVTSTASWLRLVQLQQRFAACIQVTRIVNMAVPCQTLLTWLGSAAGEDVQLEMSHTRVCVCV